MDMLINIRHNCAFQENSIFFIFFVHGFYVPELYTLKLLTQKETKVMQISAASPSPNSHSRKSYVKK